MATILIESTHKRTGETYYKRVQRRAIWLSGNLYEFRYLHKRCYAVLSNGSLVCSAQQQRYSYSYQQAA